jgi:hypothetical protein
VRASVAWMPAYRPSAGPARTAGPARPSGSRPLRR